MDNNTSVMSSDARILASRANGKLSRGPVTPAGKRKSAKNSLRHGILAQTIVLDEEDRQPFLNFIAALEHDLKPATEHERALVENMAVSRWRQMRIWGIEKAGLRHEMEKMDQTTDAPTRAALAFRSLADTSRCLDLINRYETRFDRQYHRALNSIYAKRT